MRGRGPFPPRAFATNGFPLFNDGYHTNACFWTQTNSLNAPVPGIISQTLAVRNTSYPDNLGSLYLWSNAVPAAVELEFGLLEQSAWERYNSIGNPTARLAYLQRDEIGSRVHLFRQRIPVRNVDPLAYQ